MFLVLTEVVKYLLTKVGGLIKQALLLFAAKEYGKQEQQHSDTKDNLQDAVEAQQTNSNLNALSRDELDDILLEHPETSETTPKQ